MNKTIENKSALLFGGQGSQFTEITEKICKQFGQAENIYEKLSEKFGFNILNMCLHSFDNQSNQVFYKQICTFAVEYVVYEMFLEKNIPIDVVAGFSLGEYMALLASSIIDLKQACDMVKLRAKLMSDTIYDHVGDMIAVFNLHIDEIEAICRSIGQNSISISNYNSYDQIVVSGTLDSLQLFEKAIKSLNGITVPLNMYRPFHHKLMKCAADSFQDSLCKYQLHEPRISIIMNATGAMLTQSDDIKNLMYKQIFSPVQWIQTVHVMQNFGVHQFYDISTRPILGKFVKSIINNHVNVVNIV